MKKILTLIIVSLFILVLHSQYTCAQVNVQQNLPVNNTVTNKFLIQGVDFGPYMKMLEKNIKSKWHPPKHSISERVVLLFRISKDGSLKDIKIYKSSGDMEVDAAAITAVKMSVPFDPLPAEFKGDDIPFEFTFDRKVFNGHREDVKFNFSVIQSVLLSNDRNVNFSEYKRSLEAKVKDHWNNSKDNVNESLSLSFILDKSGNASNIKVAKSSGNADTDNSAINAIMASSPFDPLPAKYKYENLPIMIIFTNNVIDTSP